MMHPSRMLSQNRVGAKIITMQSEKNVRLLHGTVLILKPKKNGNSPNSQHTGCQRVLFSFVCSLLKLQDRLHFRDALPLNIITFPHTWVKFASRKKETTTRKCKIKAKS